VVEPAKIVARRVRAVASEFDARPTSRAPMRSGVDAFCHEAGAKTERCEAPPVEGLA
jgi:hypothetical protein